MAVQPTNTIKSTGPTLIKAGTPTPSRVSSPPMIRTGPVPKQALAKDLESLSDQINKLHSTLSSIGQSIDHFQLADNQDQIVGILGSEVYQGQYVTNWLRELHIGGSPFAAQLNADGNGNLSLVNATITLTTSAGTITLDPTVPKIVVQSPAGTITIDASGPDILITNTANPATLELQSNPTQMLIKDFAGATVAQIGVDGAGHGVIVLNGPIINNPNLGTTFTGTATVRNAAGTGTSSFVIVNGIISSYTP